MKITIELDILPVELRIQLASAIKTPAELSILAMDEDCDVRTTVGNNAETSEEDLGKLARDDNSAVRFSAAVNAKTPKEDLERLQKDEFASVRKAAEVNLANRN